MSKKNKNKANKSNGNHGNEALHGELQRKKKELDLEREEFDQEKTQFLQDMADREEGLSEAMAKVKAVEEDALGYLAQLRIEKQAQLEEEMKTLHGEESARILAEQDALREDMAKEKQERGANMDRYMEERMAQTDGFIQKRREKMSQEEETFREKCLELQEKERVIQEEAHGKRLAFQEKEAQLAQEWEEKHRKLSQQQEEVQLDQAHLRGMLTRLQEEKSRLIQSYEEQLMDMERRLGVGEEKYETLWKQHQDLDHKLREFHAEIGGDLQSHQNKVGELTRKNVALEEALSLSVPRTVETERNQLREEFQKLLEQRSQWEHSILQCQTLTLEHQEMTHQLALSQGEVRFHREEKAQILVENNNLKEKVLRYSAPSAQNADMSRRLAEITEGYEISSPEESFPKDMEEMDWLRYILGKCKKAQMEFPLRVFLAFHTAMKVSDWSIITVLAGVSGTGKSKLPELYATYGGLNFISVPVQEHWDGQESMLGYFNTMDNRFEPQPLLRFLLSAIEVPSDRKGILEKQSSPDMDATLKGHIEDGERTVSLVLLDEMNLAHVEEYFAEFLSKLENRRGNREVPAVAVKLGSGMADYPLKLRRNILWSGTMNQDETTKSLSDKVLDRGVVIQFPRPEVFLRRESQRVQGTGDYRLPYKLWRKWQTRDASYQVQVETLGEMVNQEAKYEMLGVEPWDKEGQSQRDKWTNYKGMLEEINSLMTKERRALGHRVWQATEYYVVNHPFVIHEMKQSYDPDLNACVLTSGLKKSLHLAMEDQLVQKILPKLRGVEYEVDGTLDEIGGVLGKYFPALREDYNNACHQGDGQFMWATSHYGDQLQSMSRWLELLAVQDSESV